jgi:D-amino peptidase
VNALYLGGLGVPVGMISGDDALAAELGEWFPWAELVAVKRGISWQAADSIHPSRARDLIRQASQRAAERAARGDPELVPLKLEGPLRLRVAFQNPGQADIAATIPGFDRVGDRGIAFETDDAITLYRAFLSAARLASTADD